MGRIQESLDESQTLLALDPISSLGLGHIGYHYLYAREYDQAIRDLLSYLPREQSDVASYYLLGDAYYQKGMWNEAFEEYVRSLALGGMSPADVAQLREAFAKDGIRGYFRKRIEQLEAGGVAAYGPVGVQPDRMFQIAGAFARLGEKEAAFDWLERLYSQHASALLHLREDVTFDNLRGDPRFANLLQRIGLPPL
jgi:tetratricopeptide (TPR) repeat protein